MTTIVLADDHHLVREGMRALLEIEADFSVIGEAADGLSTVDMVERLKPDVLIADVMMPNLNGVEVARHVSQRVPETRIIIVSMYANEAHVLEALRNGASAYVLKDARGDDLVHAVREVIAGHHYLSKQLSERAIESYIHKAQSSTVDPYDTLTTREREILQLSAEGYTGAAIAERLSLSPRTVETHRTNMMHKLDLHNQTELVRYALRRGLITLEG
ncbi:MAG: response regulator transcription factor [Chloroflexaceae bacterium]|nr:response regulator transcription factor [Chloroflexaceae bacterium]